MSKRDWGREVAEEFSRWHLGYGQWAEDILHAQANPERALRSLADDGDEVAAEMLAEFRAERGRVSR